MAPKRRIERLIFVFNAGSGSFNAFLDSARKLLQIKGCTLCTITHGLAGEKSEWRECKEEIGVPVDYVHKDEITPELSRAIGGSGDSNLPCVIAEAGGELILLLGPDVLDRCKGSVADLKGRLGVFSAMKGLELPQALAG
jgi:hypothetical protein